MIYISDSGQIGTCLYRELSTMSDGKAIQRAQSPNSGQPGDLFVAALDGGQLHQLASWEQQAIDRSLHFLPVHVQGGEAIIGPEIRPDCAGCLSCWTRRYFGSRKYARHFAQQADLVASHGQDPWLTPLAVNIIGLITAQRLTRRLKRVDQTHEGDDNGTVFYFDLQTLTGREWPIKPDSSCPRCGYLPLDSPQRAHIEIEDKNKKSEEDDRLQSLSDLAWVSGTYTGYRSNIVSEEYVNWNFDIGAVVSVTVSLAEDRHPEPCSGFCANYRDAHAVAILEGLERYSGVRPRGMRSCVRGTVTSLRDFVVNPRSFGLHSAEEYADFPELLVPFSEDAEMDFVWAYSFGQQRCVLVPKQLAFYSLAAPGEPAFVIEGSIGCVLGSSFEECVLHGIFEVVERDAFLLTWYAELEQPMIDLSECRDPEVLYRYRHLSKQGYELLGFDITTDHGIPAVWVLARQREAKMPFSFCASAAHVRPEQAIKKSLRELTAASCRYRIELQDEMIRNRTILITEDPTQVRTMHDHALFYCAPESSRHLEFLVSSSRRTSLAAMQEQARPLWSRNLGEELRNCVSRIVRSRTDVIAVKQTPPELAAKGLQVTKTLIPGAIPMTWGRHRRLEGLQRLNTSLNLKGSGGVAGLEPIANRAPHPYP